MQLQRDVDLTGRNTLRLPARANYFVRARSESDIAEASDWAEVKQLPLLVLGGGSNVVLAADFPGLVLWVDSRGIDVVADGEHFQLHIAAGESWPELVQRCVASGWHGLENLSLIPGAVGAAPVQNIGAYGVELSRYLLSVRGWHCQQRQFVTLTRDECRFGYRDSIFKRELRDRFIITDVALQLDAQFQAELSYPALADVLRGQPQPSAAQVAAAVIAVRRSKLPDPAELPNAGSFFKNPVVSAEHYQSLCQQWGDMPRYPAPEGIKIPAGWLLEKAGWKGQRRGAVGMHQQQSLVLVNHGGACGADVLALAAAIQRDIEQRFGVALELEPRVYGDVAGG